MMQFFLPASATTQPSVPSGLAISGFSLNPLLHLQTSPSHSFSLPVHVFDVSQAENRKRFRKRKTLPEIIFSLSGGQKSFVRHVKNLPFSIVNF